VHGGDHGKAIVMSETEAVKLEVYTALVHDVGDDPTFVAEIVDNFLASCPQLLEGMREAAMADQPTDVGRLAHQLKSSSAWLGAERLAELCREIEVSARSGTLDRMDQRLHDVEEEIGRVEQALHALTERA
jgi:HPt (histidine-containing phosphotransfer) domain-containing protein